VSVRIHPFYVAAGYIMEVDITPILIYIILFNGYDNGR
jgi:hypothetical protein